jgi:hypothetical protein
VKIFISWSGSLSRRVAEALRDWLPSVLQTVQPYVSSEDIDKGARWSVDISHELQASGYGIICVTADNVSAPWLNFEAGALSNKFEESRVSPFLFGIGKDKLTGPLKQFQATVYEYDGTLRLVKSINSVAQSRMEQTRVDAAFKKWWPDLQAMLDPLKDAPSDESVPDSPGRSIEDSFASHVPPVPAPRSEQDTTRPVATTPALHLLFHRLSTL